MEFLDRIHFLELIPWRGTAIVGVRIVLIAIAAWFGAALLNRAIRTFRERIARGLAAPEQVKRAETIGRVFRYIVSVTITLIAGVLILSELGVSIAPILGAAGVVGLAIGFGAQSLVKDYFTGFFILLENQITTGDVVEIAGKSGLVEDLTLRFVRLRDYGGNVHFVPNSQITIVTNMSRGFAQAVIDVGIAYREDIDEAFEVMRQVGRELRGDAAFAAKILDDLEIAGVEKWDDSSIGLRCRFKVGPLEQWSVRREFLRRLKAAFDRSGIEIPFPHVTLYAGIDKAGNAPPFRFDRHRPSPGAAGATAATATIGARDDGGTDRANVQHGGVPHR
jgi:small conductance mechanosensitive channel